MSEANIQRRIQAQIRKAGGWVVKVHGNQYTPVGTPDLLACYRGRFIAIEVKQYDNRLSEVQQHALEMISAAGGLVTVAFPNFDFETWINACSG